MAERALLITERTVIEDRQPEYDLAWSDLRTVAVELGIHAWRYRSTEQPSRFVEFLEFRGGADPRQSQNVRSVLGRLEDVAAGSPETWADAT